MSELDGDWELQRLSGVLPPLGAIRKRIHGDRGATVFGRTVGAFRMLRRATRAA